jgi:predicted alpha/beta hydrolase family esterase
MKQTIIIHGMPDKEEYHGDFAPSPSNAHWIPWLQKQLNKKDIISQALEMPQPYFPVYEKYIEVFEQMKISTETTLIGHSCGGGFLIRFLSENPTIKPKQVVLVAPWIDLESYLRDQGGKFFDFELDKDLANRIEVHVFISSDDDEPMIDTVNKLKAEVPNIIYHEFTDKGHFTKGDLGTEEFPELLEVLI